MVECPIIPPPAEFNVTINLRRAEIKTPDFSISWNPTDVVPEVVERLQKLSRTFKVPLNDVWIDAELAYQLETTGSLLSTCRKLYLTSIWSIGKQEDVDLIFARIRMKELRFNVGRCKITQSHIFSLDKLVIETGHWMTQDDLLKCENEHLHILDHELDEHAINSYLKKWQSGGNRKLEVALFDKKIEGEWDLSLVLNGLNASHFDIKNRDKMYFPIRKDPEFFLNVTYDYVIIDSIQFGVEAHDAMDIRRADGTWASIGVNDTSNQIRILVWKDAHPSEYVLDKLNKECNELEARIKVKQEFLEAEERSDEEKEAIDSDICELKYWELKIKRELIQTIREKNN